MDTKTFIYKHLKEQLISEICARITFRFGLSLQDISSFSLNTNLKFISLELFSYLGSNRCHSINVRNTQLNY